MLKSRINSDESSDEEEDTSISESSDTKPKTIVGVTSVVDETHQFFLGKDYSNYYQKDFEFIEKFDEDYIDRKLVPRMPWHHEILVVSGEAARDCADKYRFNDFYPYLLPKTCDDDEVFDTSFLRSILPDDRPPIRIDAQCVRSASFWSYGIRTVERSNQFFVTIPNDSAIKNHIGDAIYRRIMRAHANKEKFRIHILLALLPGFSNANTIQAVLHFIMRSINKGEMSLYQRLKQNGVSNPEDYITFYGMRNWDILMGSLVTEIIYVHSKLMIVDDRMCICGSTNINDRSLQGSRDSEICLVVNDIEMIDSYLNGRIKNEDESNLDDPCSDEFYQYFRRIAQQNTEIYEEVFNSLLTNQVRRFIDVEANKKRSKLKETDPKK
ncbi:unnamed protein product [Rotaria sp. Silwood2]|nr:unnamed protein product [Rotaria sp. Silwood2]CAF4224562.1 unnamed protein product [Rotaria sp. Silwood2]